MPKSTGSLAEDLIKEVAVRALFRALANARTREAKAEVLARVLMAIDDPEAAAEPGRRSPRIHPTRAQNAKPEQEEKTPEEKEPSLLLPTGPRQVRVKKPKALLQPPDKVGGKRTRRTEI
ncbi:hypothetical protein PF005_g21253 [Phytophthora fragariae]|uniref:Uncharacterized protein n=1 Tax=Phytophthora fragariae TaxID=53985 RepID=A0A6A3X9G8_9STRA|nr:hypothetical protein PF003_g40388 [Phytophthora fragariae]KAE8927583.1 hypothetical protein PF009_g22255 [Phytophthora fragariae]KAE8986274.1 hypothetical protein PF011_g20058 [Phytophthora fragariae]KAE9084983.1 hypothetical protein PF007_g21315 [Phytophthora fragariae]KAE9085452.1 hypothetical protein PF010_g20456 [Phytophthora fragariae]